MHIARSMKKRFLAIPYAASLCAAANCFAADNLLWPESGLYPAYPLEQRADPLRVHIGAEAAQDSNLFRVSDDTQPLLNGVATERSAVVSKLNAGVDANLELSRQQFLFNAQATQTWYQHFSFLDHLGYGGGLNWRWQAGDPWSGELGYTQDRTQASFAELQGPIEDLLTHKYAHGSAALRIRSLRLRGLAEDIRYEHSNDTQRILDNHVVAGTVGIDFIADNDNSFGVQYKQSKGDYPNREPVDLALGVAQLVDNQYREYESSAVLGLKFGAGSRLDARVGQTERRYEDLSSRDFKGITWRVGLEHLPSAKVLLRLSGYREVQSIEELTASYAVVSGVSFMPAWTPTIKSVLQANLIYENRQLEGSPALVLGVELLRKDIKRAARVGAGYQPLDGLQLAVSYERGSRTSTVSTAEYDYDVTALNMTWAF